MTLGQDVAERLAQPDWVQLAMLLFVALLFTFFVGWPTRPEQAHNSWYAVAQVRLIGLTLLALGYGSALAGSTRRDQLVAALSLLALALLSAPLDLISYALSYPALPPVYAAALPLLDTVAFFGLGLILGRIFFALRLGTLLPLVAPAALAGLVALDVSLGVTILNPLTALSSVAPAHLLAMVLLAAATVAHLLRPSSSRTPEPV